MQRRGGFGELSEKLVAGLLCSLLTLAVTYDNITKITAVTGTL